MTHRSRFALAFIVVVGLAACTPTQPTPPAQVTVINNNTNTNGGGGTSASPAPGTGGLIAVVKVGEVGERCPTGKSPAEDAGRLIRVSCTSFVTCSPKDSNGVDVPISVSGIKPDLFAVVSGSQFVRFTTWDDNGFNADVTAISPGQFTLQCVVKGVPSERFDWTVVP